MRGSVQGTEERGEDVGGSVQGTERGKLEVRSEVQLLKKHVDQLPSLGTSWPRLRSSQVCFPTWFSVWGRCWMQF